MFLVITPKIKIKKEDIKIQWNMGIRGPDKNVQ